MMKQLIFFILVQVIRKWSFQEMKVTSKLFSFPVVPVTWDQRWSHFSSKRDTKEMLHFFRDSQILAQGVSGRSCLPRSKGGLKTEV